MAANPPITLEQIALLARRKEKLRAAADDLEALMTGRGTTLAALGATDAPGRAALTEQLVRAYAQNESIDALKERNDFGRYQSCTLENAPLATEPTRADLVRPFFACAVRLAADTPWYAGTMDDVVALAQSVQRHRGREMFLLMEELYDGTEYLAEDVPRPDDFFAMMDDIYLVLTQTPIADAMPTTLRERAIALDPEAFGEDALPPELFYLSPAQLDEAIAAGGPHAALIERNREMLEAQWNALMDEIENQAPWEIEAQEVAEREGRKRRQRTTKLLVTWRESFADAEGFCQQYLAFRHAFFEGEPCPVDFADLANRAAETVLVQRGKNLLADKEKVDEALYLLGRVRSRLGRPAPMEGTHE